jgi:hypothetical protein
MVHIRWYDLTLSQKDGFVEDGMREEFYLRFVPQGVASIRRFMTIHPKCTAAKALVWSSPRCLSSTCVHMVVGSSGKSNLDTTFSSSHMVIPYARWAAVLELDLGNRVSL